MPVPMGISRYVRTTAEMKISEISKNITIPEAIDKVVPLESINGLFVRKTQPENTHIKLSIINISVIAWIAIVVFLSAGTITWTFHVHRLVKRLPIVTRPDVKELLKRKSWELGIKQNCELYIMDGTIPVGPTVIGVFKPKILLPCRVVENFSIKDIEPVLVHELVHIKRHDLFTNWVQIIIQIVYFFHPLVWYANYKIREYREEICDDLTIQNIENKRKRYSQSILNVLEGIVYEPAWGYIDIGFSERKSSLARRIIRITNGRYQFHKPLNILSTLLLAAVSLISVSLSCDYSPEKITGAVQAVEKYLPDSISTEEDPERIYIKILNEGEYDVDGIPASDTNLEETIKQVLTEKNKNHFSIQSNGKNISPILDVMRKLEINKFRVMK